MLTPVSYDHVTSSYNYDEKKARTIDPTFCCHLSNVMPDSIFHERMRQGITWFVVAVFCLFFYGAIILFSSGNEIRQVGLASLG